MQRNRFEGEPDLLPYAESGKRVRDLAQEEAESRQHNYIGTDHLVLALTREEISSQALRDAGIDPAKIWAKVHQRIGKGIGPVPQTLPLTPMAKAVLLRAGREAESGLIQEVTSIDILRSTVLEEEGIGPNVLREIGNLNAQNVNAKIPKSKR